MLVQRSFNNSQSIIESNHLHLVFWYRVESSWGLLCTMIGKIYLLKLLTLHTVTIMRGLHSNAKILYYGEGKIMFWEVGKMG